MKDLNGKEGERVKIATIELQTKLYTSEAGDNRLFFQHIRMEKDYRSFPKNWRRGAHITPDFPDFKRERIDKAQHGNFPAFEGLDKKDHK